VTESHCLGETERCGLRRIAADRSLFSTRCELYRLISCVGVTKWICLLVVLSLATNRVAGHRSPSLDRWGVVRRAVGHGVGLAGPVASFAPANWASLPFADLRQFRFAGSLALRDPSLESSASSSTWPPSRACLLRAPARCRPRRPPARLLEPPIDRIVAPLGSVSPVNGWPTAGAWVSWTRP